MPLDGNEEISMFKDFFSSTSDMPGETRSGSDPCTVLPIAREAEPPVTTVRSRIPPVNENRESLVFTVCCGVLPVEHGGSPVFTVCCGVLPVEHGGSLVFTVCCGVLPVEHGEHPVFAVHGRTPSKECRTRGRSGAPVSSPGPRLFVLSQS